MWIQGLESLPPASSRRTRVEGSSAQAGGEHASRRAGAGDDVVMVGHDRRYYRFDAVPQIHARRLRGQRPGVRTAGPAAPLSAGDADVPRVAADRAFGIAGRAGRIRVHEETGERAGCGAGAARPLRSRERQGRERFMNRHRTPRRTCEVTSSIRRSPGGRRPEDPPGGEAPARRRHRPPDTRRGARRAGSGGGGGRRPARPDREHIAPGERRPRCVCGALRRRPAEDRRPGGETAAGEAAVLRGDGGEGGRTRTRSWPERTSPLRGSSRPG